MKKEYEPKSFVVKFRPVGDGSFEKDIFIDGERLNYSIDLAAYLDACKISPQMKLVVQKDIERHFIESVGEYLGRKVTTEEIKEAIKTGWI